MNSLTSLSPGLDCDSLTDFAQYYHAGRANHFFLARDIATPESQQYYPAALSTAARGAVVLYLFLPDGNVVREYPETGLENWIKTGQVQGGNFEVADSYMYMRRGAPRTAAKGLYFAEVDVWMPDAGGYAQLNLNKLWGQDSGAGAHSPINFTFARNNNYKVWYSAILSALTPSEFSYNEQLSRLLSGEKIGAMIDRNIGLYFKEGEHNIQVSFGSRTVAEVQPDPHYITIKESFQGNQRLTEYLRRSLNNPYLRIA